MTVLHGTFHRVCPGARVIGFVTESQVVWRILAHLERLGVEPRAGRVVGCESGDCRTERRNPTTSATSCPSGLV